MVVHLQSPDQSVSMLDLGNYARLRVQDELLSIPGVSSAPVFGAGEYAMRVWLDPLKMEAQQLTPNDIAAAIREQNIQVAAGSLGQQPDHTARPFEISLVTQGRLSTVEEFRDIVVKRTNGGHLTRLGDVARVELGANAYSLRSLLDNQNAAAIPDPAITGQQRPGSSDRSAGNNERLAPSFPDGITYRVVYDPTQFVAPD